MMRHAGHASTPYPDGADFAHEAEENASDGIDGGEERARDKGEVVALVVEEGHLGHRKEVPAARGRERGGHPQDTGR